MTAEFRKTWVLQSKSPEPMRSGVSLSGAVSHEVAPGSPRPQPGSPEHPAGLQPAPASTCRPKHYSVYRPVALADGFLCLELSGARWLYLVKLPFERKMWQKAFPFWKKGDFKTVSKIFSWVMSATVFYFSALLYRLGFSARWCQLSCPSPMEAPALLFPQQ